ncbi:MAG: Lrp/AsnC family transcriptional regulator [Sphingomonadales bacterium]|nr:Lrp/AsnC family transcriptional regulator [Sphingomonadales bacterium]
MTGKQLVLDRIDMQILVALKADGRMSKVDLAKLVGLSPTPCCMRVDKLEAAGYIKGYHADIDVEGLGDLSQYIVTVSIKDYTPDKARQFEELVKNSRYIAECEAVFGSIDYIMRIYAQSVRHYQEIVEPFLVMEIDYTTYPVSRNVHAREQMNLFGILSGGSASKIGSA